MVPLARRVTAWVSLLALVVGLALPMLPGFHVAAATEDDCIGAPGSLGERGIDAGDSSTARPEHCLMCHWLRTAGTAQFGPAAPPEPPRVVRPATLLAAVDAPTRLLVLERPSRAPPRA